jgi:hypothetical protein
MKQLLSIVNSEAFWAAVVVLFGYLANSIVSRGWLAKMPPTSPLRRTVRAFHGFLNKIDPMILALAVALPMLTGCAGTLEETRGQVRMSHLVGVQTAARDAIICRNISSKERIWTGVAVGGTFLAGASGIALFPVESHTQEQILKASIIGAGLGAGVGLVEQQSYAREWQRENCDQ